jgi:death on curing protein
MENPIFLDLDEVLEIHRDQVGRYGGISGIRDFGLLQSAVNMPAMMYGGEYLHQDLFEIAAAYLFHLINNHPFMDGNKRTGTVTALVFLSLNGVDIDADERAFEELVTTVAMGVAAKAEIADFLRAYAVSTSE